MALTPTPEGADPLAHVQWLAVTDLQPNPWNPNRVHRAELRLLERSLLLTGWLQPVLANPDGLIIDGFHRWMLSRESKAVHARWAGLLPVAVLDLSRPEAMLATIRINRAKGTHVAVEMHKIVAELLTEHGYTAERVAEEMGATLDEVNVLSRDGVFALRNTADWSYSKAWVPEENGETVAQSRARRIASR